ncbi:MAG: aldehyde reductase [Paracoccaceae bacterium]
MTQKILVTGASGYIAKHIILQLLNGGYSVRGSVRSDKRADEVRAAMAAHLQDKSALERLEFVELDLTDDAGWDAALLDVDVLMHTASPFPLSDPKDEDDLIRPAVDGSLRALKAAKKIGVARVVLTSSTVAVMHKNAPDNGIAFNESDWSDVDHPGCSAYGKSKILAERAAWDFCDANPEIHLTTINPSLVLGPALDTNIGSSLSIIGRVLTGKDPAVPRLSFPIVDVRDIAKMHVAALENSNSIGQRFIGAAGSMWFVDIAKLVKEICPDRKIATRVAPNWLMRVMALWDGTIRGIVPLLGHEVLVDASAARKVLGVDFIPNTQTITDTVRHLLDNDLA